MGLRGAATLLLLVMPLRAQDLSELLQALSGTAAIFASTAPGLGADETLDQRGRRGFIGILKGKVPTVKNSELSLPEDFTQHRVLSRYSLGPVGEGAALHETRTAVEVDGVNADALRKIRHALWSGLADSRRLDLEDFEHEQLEGSVTDFGPLILLFAARHLTEYDFALGARDKIGDEPVVLLTYRQTSGTQGLTFFAQRTAERQTMEGTIWFRASDLLPLRITMKTRKTLSKNYSVDTDASVDYVPSRYGLVPAAVTHRQYLNAFLLVENDLHYSNYHHTGPELIP
jgi:hypothetical protein